MNRTAAALTLALLCLLGAPLPSAQAQGVELFLDQRVCGEPAAQDAPPASPLSVALTLELVDAALVPAPEFSPGRFGLSLLDCDLSDGTLSLLLVRAPMAEPETTELVLSDVPQAARPRTAAVAVVEWLRTLDQATPANSTSPASTPPPAATTSKTPAPSPSASLPKPPPSKAPKPPARQKSSVLVQLGGGVTLLGRDPLLLPGGRLTLRDTVVDRLWLIGGVSYFATGKDTSLGRARLHVLLFEAALGFSVLPTEWLTFSVVTQWGPSWAQGKSELGVSERPSSRALVILRGRLELKVPLAQRWALSALADFGPILRGVDYTAAGAPAFSLRSYAGEGSLHLEFAP